MLVGPFEVCDHEEPFERSLTDLRRYSKSRSSKGFDAARGRYRCLLQLVRDIVEGERPLEISDYPKLDRWLVYDCGYAIWIYAATRDLVVFLDAFPDSDPLEDLL